VNWGGAICDVPVNQSMPCKGACPDYRVCRSNFYLNVMTQTVNRYGTCGCPGNYEDRETSTGAVQPCSICPKEYAQNNCTQLGVFDPWACARIACPIGTRCHLAATAPPQPSAEIYCACPGGEKWDPTTGCSCTRFGTSWNMETGQCDEACNRTFCGPNSVCVLDHKEGVRCQCVNKYRLITGSDGRRVCAEKRRKKDCNPRCESPQDCVAVSRARLPSSNSIVDTGSDAETQSLECACKHFNQYLNSDGECVCLPGWSGNICNFKEQDLRVSAIQCPPDSTLQTNTDGNVQCICNAGFNPTEGVNCGNNVCADSLPNGCPFGQCVVTGDGPKCTCPVFHRQDNDRCRPAPLRNVPRIGHKESEKQCGPGNRCYESSIEQTRTLKQLPSSNPKTSRKYSLKSVNETIIDEITVNMEVRTSGALLCFSRLLSERISPTITRSFLRIPEWCLYVKEVFELSPEDERLQVDNEWEWNAIEGETTENNGLKVVSFSSTTVDEVLSVICQVSSGGNTQGDYVTANTLECFLEVQFDPALYSDPTSKLCIASEILGEGVIIDEEVSEDDTISRLTILDVTQTTYLGSFGLEQKGSVVGTSRDIDLEWTRSENNLTVCVNSPVDRIFIDPQLSFDNTLYEDARSFPDNHGVIVKQSHGITTKSMTLFGGMLIFIVILVSTVIM